MKSIPLLLGCLGLASAEYYNTYGPYPANEEIAKYFEIEIETIGDLGYTTDY